MTNLLNKFITTNDITDIYNKFVNLTFFLYLFIYLILRSVLDSINCIIFAFLYIIISFFIAKL